MFYRSLEEKKREFSNSAVIQYAMDKCCNTCPIYSKVRKSTNWNIR